MMEMINNLKNIKGILNDGRDQLHSVVLNLNPMLDQVIDDACLVENNYEVLKAKNVELRIMIDDLSRKLGKRFGTRLRRYLSHKLFYWARKLDVVG